jgi:PmbA protein
VKEKKEYMDLALWAVEQAKAAGADGAEAYISDSESVQINVSGRQVEQVQAVLDAGIGVRFLKDLKIAFGSSNDLAKDSVKSLISDLAKKVVFHTQDEFSVLAGKESGVLDKDWSSYPDLISYDPQIGEVPIQDKIKSAIRLEASGLDYSPKVKGAMVAVYQDGSSYVYFANSNGIGGWFPSAGVGGGIELSAAEGNDQESGSFSKTVANYRDFNPDEIGRKAAENAVKMLGAKPIESCEVPLVVSPEIGTQMLSFIVSMLSADEVQKGKSMFAGKLGSKVGSASFTLVDDGRLKGGLATRPVDGEGVPQQTTPLIVEGILKNFLYDCYTAKKGKVKSTGNRSRGDYQGRGGIGTTNLFMKQGNAKPEAIMAGISKGFYLTVALGLFAGIDPVSGDFSIPVAGFMIENGKVSFPIRGISIGGNLFEFLNSVDKIGDDLTWFGTTACPTFSTKSIKIGGVSRKK